MSKVFYRVDHATNVVKRLYEMARELEMALPPVEKTEGTFIHTAEQVLPVEREDGKRLYEVDGFSVLADQKFFDHLTDLRRSILEFVAGCPLMENLGDNQDSVEAVCRATGIPKPCYGEYCCGCDTDDDDCASPDEDWR